MHEYVCLHARRASGDVLALDVLAHNKCRCMLWSCLRTTSAHACFGRACAQQVQMLVTSSHVASHVCECKQSYTKTKSMQTHRTDDANIHLTTHRRKHTFRRHAHILIICLAHTSAVNSTHTHTHTHTSKKKSARINLPRRLRVQHPHPPPQPWRTRSSKQRTHAHQA
jgi:hypothetical protein